MSKEKINSNVYDAQGAVKELTGISESDLQKQTLELGSSNVESMLAGANLTNRLMDDVTRVVNCVLLQANKFPELAHAIEQRDIEEAGRFQ